MPIIPATREAEVGELNPGVGGCSEPRSRTCTPAWATERDSGAEEALCFGECSAFLLWLLPVFAVFPCLCSLMLVTCRWGYGVYVLLADADAIPFCLLVFLLTVRSLSCRCVGVCWRSIPDPVCLGWWECQLVQTWWKTVWPFLKDLELDIAFLPATPLPGIHPKVDKSC